MVKRALYVLGLAAALLPAAAMAQGGPPLEVGVGNATLVRLAGAVHHIIIGNPGVADVSIDAPRLITLFGRSPGGTTLVVMDAAGQPLIDAKVVVTAGGPTSVLVTNARAGGESIAYHCGTITCVRAGGSAAAAAPAAAAGR
jgi:Flp pilus assembly secretin CpaC